MIVTVQIKMTEDEINKACLLKISKVFSISEECLTDCDIFGEGLLEYRSPSSFLDGMFREQEIDYLIEPIGFILCYPETKSLDFIDIITVKDYCNAMNLVYNYDQELIEDFFSEKVNVIMFRHYSKIWLYLIAILISIMLITFISIIN